MIDLVLLTVSFGMAVAVSPCQLPIYPVLLGVLSKGGSKKAKVLAFTAGHALMYAIVYLLLALLLRTVGGIVMDETLGKAYVALYFFAALVCFAFSLQNIGWLDFFSRTMHFNPKVGDSVFGALLSGVFFATVVSPCNLPFLIAFFLPLISRTETILQGVSLVLVFTSVLSSPLIVMGLISEYAFRKWLAKRQKMIEAATSSLLALTGVYLLYLAMLTFINL
ncbi:MAG: cytochrome c biogenesis protein CcdA [Candidatus Altiarchaeota archaeon]|nr:cytochrome c biogenesis protein CcdA [Candidatus Altiarchaeota archaeon]